MNKVESLPDGTRIMTVYVDGQEAKRFCHIEFERDRGCIRAKDVPELNDGEELFETISGASIIVKMYK